MAVADAGGIGALTIRTLAQSLGVKPMSVYYYVANKDEILDAIVDLVFAEIELPVAGGEWRDEMARARELGPCSVTTPPVGHPDSCSRASTLAPRPCAITMRSSAACARPVSPWSRRLTHSRLIDSYVYGFALQEHALPINGPRASRRLLDR